MSTYREWLDGVFEKIDPDVVESDVGNMWRTLYKLEKTFSETPLPKQMAEKVRGGGGIERKKKGIHI